MFPTYPCIGYLCVFHDLLRQDNCISTLKLLNSVQELFEETSESLRFKHFLIEGQVGIGKTTICKEICYQWAENNLFTPDELVLLLLLQDPEVQKITSEYHLANYFVTTFDFTEPFMEYLISSCGAGVTIVIEGYDQLNEENQFLKDLIEGNSLPKARIVATSTPCVPCHIDCVGRRIEIFELENSSKNKFIAAALKSYPEKFKILQKHFQRYPKIDMLSCIPLIMAIMVTLCQKDETDLPCDAVSLYKAFCQYVMENNFHNVVDDIIEKLERCLAIQTQSLFRFVPIDWRMQVLSMCVSTFKVHTEDKLTVLEMVHKLNEDFGSRNIRSYESRYFARQTNHIGLLFEQFNADVEHNYVSEFVSFVPLCSQVDPRKKDTQLVNICRLQFFSKSNLNIVTDHSIDMMHYYLLPYQIFSLGLFLSETYKEVSELHLAGCSIGDYGLYLLYRYLCAGIKCRLNLINLQSNNLTSASSVFISIIIDHVKPKSLGLSYNNLTDTGVAKLCTAVVRNSVHTLDLLESGLTAQGTKSVVLMMKNLEELDISYNHINDDGAEILSQGIKQTATLRRLDVNHCNIGEVGAGKLAHSLTINSSLEVLWMNSNAIGQSGATEIATALCTNSMLKELSLIGDVTIDYAAASEILSSLYKNTTLIDLDFPACLSDKESLTTELEDININRSKDDYEPLCVSFW